jgi:hypothetical protein
LPTIYWLSNNHLHVSWWICAAAAACDLQAFQYQFMVEVLTVLNSLPLANAPADTSEQYLAASRLVAGMTDAQQYAVDNDLPPQQFVEAAAQALYVWHPARELQLQLQESFQEQVEGLLPIIVKLKTDSEQQKLWPEFVKQRAAALREGGGPHAVLLQQLVTAALRNEAQLQLLQCGTSIETDQALLQLLQDDAALAAALQAPVATASNAAGAAQAPTAVPAASAGPAPAPTAVPKQRPRGSIFGQSRAAAAAAAVAGASSSSASRSASRPRGRLFGPTSVKAPAGNAQPGASELPAPQKQQQQQQQQQFQEFEQLQQEGLKVLMLVGASFAAEDDSSSQETLAAASQVMASLQGSSSSAAAVPELLQQAAAKQQRQAALLSQLLESQRKQHEHNTAAAEAAALLQGGGGGVSRARLAAAVAARLQHKQLLQRTFELMERLQVELAAGQPAWPASA